VNTASKINGSGKDIEKKWMYLSSYQRKVLALLMTSDNEEEKTSTI